MEKKNKKQEDNKEIKEKKKNKIVNKIKNIKNKKKKESNKKEETSKRKETKLEEKKLKKEKRLKKKAKKDEEERLYFSLAEVVVIFILALLLGGVLGGLAVFSKSKSDKDLEDFHSFYYDITKNYYKKINKEELVNAAIDGMLNYLGDPYSNYMDEEETNNFDTTVNGSYKGIGVTVAFVNEKPTVIGVFKNSPADKAGLKENDILLTINKKDVSGKTLDQIVEIIKSSNKADIVVLRDDKKKKFTISLDTVLIPSVTSEVYEKNDKKIGVISVSVFSLNTYNEFNTTLKSLEKKKIDSLVIDVRENPGGHLDQVTKVLSLFMDKKKVIYQIKSNKKTTKVYSETNEKRDYPVAVLIDGNSASAAEVLTAGLKESYNAKVVGVKSYGKGTVQKEYSLSSGSSVKYTIEQWLTPKGKSINGKGIEPTDKVELSEDYFKNPSAETDNQLQTALDLVSK